jgi:hypothetical protein
LQVVVEKKLELGNPVFGAANTIPAALDSGHGKTIPVQWWGFQPLLTVQASPPLLLYGNKYGREDGNTTLGIAVVFRIALNDIKKGLNQIQPYLIVIIRGGNQI